MHGYGIVRDLLSQVEENVRAADGRRATRIWLSVSGLDPAEEREIRDAFEAFRAGTAASRAELILERQPADALCLDCGQMVPPGRIDDRNCELCGGDAIRFAAGESIHLKSVEIEV